MKQKILLMMVVLVMCCIIANAQTKKQTPVKKTTTTRPATATTTKERQVGSDGYIWYKLKKGNLYGAQDIEGNEIIPIQYDEILYYSYKCRYFIVKTGDFAGVYTRMGKLLISTDKHYTGITHGNLGYKVKEKVFWVAKRNTGGQIILDCEGKEVFTINDSWLITMDCLYQDHVVRVPDANYFTVSCEDGSDWKVGIYDLVGKEICPPMYEGPIFVYDWGETLSGWDPLRKKTWKKKIDGLDFLGGKFNYNSFHDLYISDASYTYSSSSSSNSSSSSSSSNGNSSSGSSTTTVVVEQHGPVQVWVACGACGHNPGVCQTCVGMGTSASGRSCISCHGTGKCHFCNGQGGRYQVEYR